MTRNRKDISTSKPTVNQDVTKPMSVPLPELTYTSNDPSKKAHETQDAPNDHHKPTPLQSLATYALKTCLPFMLACTAFMSTMSSLYHGDAEDMIRDNVSQSVGTTMQHYLKRRRWIDEKLPEAVSS